MLGIDLVIPDITYLREHADKVKGFFITHGHEDHIGAIPYVLKELNVPIYATKLTIGIIDNRLREHNMLSIVKRKVVKYGQHINLGNFRVEFIKTNHSIQDAAALAIYSPAGIVVHTGDFKVDYTPVFGDAIDLARLGEIGKKGVLALMCDSTNAERPGFTMTERSVGRTFDNIFSEHRNSRIIIATFASNVDRVQQIINFACKYGRKVVVEGRSMVNIISTATELGYLDIPAHTLIDVEQLKDYPDEQTVLITTGSQGESMAALSRMASGMHKKITIKPKDTIIFSSNPIPGNEKAVSNVINELFRKGADVICQDTHVSGHACQEDIKLIYSLVRPKYAIPVHGEYRHLMAQAKIAEELGYNKENIFILSSGDVLELDENGADLTGHGRESPEYRSDLSLLAAYASLWSVAECVGRFSWANPCSPVWRHQNTFSRCVTPARVSLPRWWFVNSGWSAFWGLDKPLSEKYMVNALAVLAIIGTNLVLRPFPVSVTVGGFCRRTSRTRKSQISWTRAPESYMRLSRSISRRPYLVEVSVWLKILCTSSGER